MFEKHIEYLGIITMPEFIRRLQSLRSDKKAYLVDFKSFPLMKEGGGNLTSIPESQPLYECYVLYEVEIEDKRFLNKDTGCIQEGKM